MVAEEFGSSEAGKMGGKARAEKLSKEQRQLIARQAAAARWGNDAPLRATHEGILRIGTDIELPCYVLEDETRVLARIQFIEQVYKLSRIARNARGFFGLAWNLHHGDTEVCTDKNKVVIMRP